MDTDSDTELGWLVNGRTNSKLDLPLQLSKGKEWKLKGRACEISAFHKKYSLSNSFSVLKRIVYLKAWRQRAFIPIRCKRSQAVGLKPKSFLRGVGSLPSKARGLGGRPGLNLTPRGGKRQNDHLPLVFVISRLCWASSLGLNTYCGGGKCQNLPLMVFICVNEMMDGPLSEIGGLVGMCPP